MPFVSRNDDGEIEALSRGRMEGFEEELPEDSRELAEFLKSIESAKEATLRDTDIDFIRVLEDVVQLLIEKGVILFTELPSSAQDKMLRRQELRSKVGQALNLLEDID